MASRCVVNMLEFIVHRNVQTFQLNKIFLKTTTYKRCIICLLSNNYAYLFELFVSYSIFTEIQIFIDIQLEKWRRRKFFCLLRTLKSITFQWQCYIILHFVLYFTLLNFKEFCIFSINIILYRVQRITLCQYKY